VRTFALDLNAVRAQRNTHTPANTTTAAEIEKKPVADAVLVTLPTTAVKNAPALSVIKKSTTAPTAVIPPFHTFQKPVTAPRQIPALKPVAPTKVIDVSAVEKAPLKPSILAIPHKETVTITSKPEVEAGTIITDNKHKRFSLLGALFGALANWWQIQKAHATERKKPKYTVPEASRRKGIIQQATVQTGRTVAADYQTVVARVKTTQKATLVKRNTNLPSVPSATPVWETATEQPTAMPVVTTPEIISLSDAARTVSLPEPQPKIEPAIPVLLPIEKQSAANILPTTTVWTNTINEVPDIDSAESLPPVVVSKIPEPRVLVKPVSEPAPTAVSITPLNRPRIEPIIPQTVSAPVVITPLVPATVIVNQPPIELDVPHAARPAANWELAARSAYPSDVKKIPIRTARVRPWLVYLRIHQTRILTGLLSLVILFSIGWFSLNKLQNSNQGGVVTENIDNNPIFNDTTLYTEAVTSLNKNTIIATIKEKSAGGDSLVEVSVADPGSGQTLSANQLFVLLEANVLIDFEASLIDVRLGGYRGEPWLVLQTTDTATARGGLLDWEKNMSRDLSPWFGTAINKNVRIGITAFTDDMVGTHDVRVLLDDTGTERITYGFITPNHLLITSNTTAFLNLADKVNQ
jgi:hypothetical protein